MITRMWRGEVPTVRADAYLTYLKRTGLADTRTFPGTGSSPSSPARSKIEPSS